MSCRQVPWHLDRRGYPLQRIIYDPNSRVPTSAAAAAVIALAGSRTMVSTGGSLVLARRDRAYRQAIVEWRRSIHEVGGVSDADIRRNSPAKTPIGLNGLILPGREPEFHARQILADPNNVPEMLDALQITGIMPAEVAVFGTIDKVSYGLYPAGMSETSEAFLHGRFDVWKRISAAQGVAMEANRFRNLLQETAEAAPIGRECVSVPWHFAGIA